MKASFLIIPMLLLSAGTRAPNHGGPTNCDRSNALKAPPRPAERRWWIWKLVPRRMPKPTADRGTAGR
jgi:hypothetical protein